MFNDLNNPNNQNRQVVDDIFAETDKPQEDNSASPMSASPAASRPGGSEIDAQRIGLTAAADLSGDNQEKKGQDKLFKIIIVAIVLVILGLGGYLVYSKLLKTPAVTETTPTVEKTGNKSVSEPVVSNPVVSTGSFVETVNPAATTTPLIPGVNAPALATTTATTSLSVSLVDSDDDGLTDAEEETAGTNINIIDTDSDELSDYEEVKIYKTNPLSADTDGDSYLDGAEVKSGYNPNGAGKLSEAAPLTPANK
jgi:hypothetical protein